MSNTSKKNLKRIREDITTTEVVVPVSSPRPIKKSNGEKYIVAIVGESHSFSYVAAHKFFNEYCFEHSISLTAAPVSYFETSRNDQVFDSVKAGTATYGFVRIESSSTGTVQTAYDGLLKNAGSVCIVGEIGDVVKVCAFGKTAIPDLDICKVYGRNDVLLASSNYLNALDEKRVAIGRSRVERILSSIPTECTKESKEYGVISLCSSESGFHRNLVLIHDNVSNDNNNQARYIVIARCSNDELHDPLKIRKLDVPCMVKTSIVVALKDKPGSIFKASACFALRELSISKMESRPAITASTIMNLDPAVTDYTKKHWNLVFYMDIESTSGDEEKLQSAIRNLKEFCPFCKIVGSYKSNISRNKTEVAPAADWKTILSVATL